MYTISDFNSGWLYLNTTYFDLSSGVTKDEGGPFGEGGERYYNYARLVRIVD